MSEKLVDLATEIAAEAGAYLLAASQQKLPQVLTKTTATDLVSEIDLNSEKLIRERLRAARPDDRVLGEEGGESEGGDLCWIVDPLDGTVNFLHAIPQWCVTIALRQADGETLLGVTFDPIRNEMFTVTRERGTRLNGGSVAWPRCESLSHALVSTGFNYSPQTRAAQGKVVASLLPQVADIRRGGAAALDLAWTAIGRYDAFYERGVQIWDIAAGQLMCEQSGLIAKKLTASEPVGGGLLVAGEAIFDQLEAIVG